MSETTTITPEERAKLISHVNSGYMTISGEGLKKALTALEQAEVRALTWTHEPPKVAGWYWRKDITAKDTIHICKIFCVNDASLFPPSEWAGPIAPPVEEQCKN